jgi:hypothetical protein
MDLAKERGNGAAFSGRSIQIHPFCGADLDVVVPGPRHVCVDLTALNLEGNAFDLKGRRHLIKGEACRRVPPLLV